MSQQPPTRLHVNSNDQHATGGEHSQPQHVQPHRQPCGSKLLGHERVAAAAGGAIK